MSQKLNNATIIKKGIIDIISNGKYSALVAEESSMKRCGGQGDVLCGVLATFASYRDESDTSTPLLEAVLSCILTRKAAKESN